MSEKRPEGRPEACSDCNKNALINLSAEISADADRFASEAANSVGLDEKIMWLDIYMMYYRIEYTRLYDARKVFTVCVCHDYDSISDDTGTAGEDEKFNFDESAIFCFHEADYDPECLNCAAKHRLEKP